MRALAFTLAFTVIVAFAASVVSAFIHEALQRDARTTDLARRIVVTAAVVYAPAANVTPQPLTVAT